MSLGKFIKSKAFFINAISMLIATVFLLWLTLLCVNRYTNHGEAFPTPNVVDLEKANYRNVLAQKGLRYEIRDSVYEKNRTPGSVKEQYPLPGHYVKEGRMIYLTIAAESPEQVVMPNLSDISLRQAKTLLAKSGLVLGELIFKPSQYDELVLDQTINGETIKPGNSIDRGSMIDLIVGKQDMSATTKVPELFGLSIIDVEELLNEANLNLGSVIYDGLFETEEDSLQAIVLRQSPTSNARKTRQGSAVDVWLAFPSDTIQTEGEEEFEEIDNF